MFGKSNREEIPRRKSQQRKWKKSCGIEERNYQKSKEEILLQCGGFKNKGRMQDEDDQPLGSAPYHVFPRHHRGTSLVRKFHPPMTTMET